MSSDRATHGYDSDLIQGLSYGDWTAEWWRWVHSISKDEHPSEGDNCANCSGLQTDPDVWFLTGSQASSHQDRSCDVAAGREILFPVVNFDCSFAEYPNLKSESQLLNYAKSQIDSVKQETIKVTVDNKPYTLSGGDGSGEICRILSIYDVRFVQDNIYKVKPCVTRAASDGYWVFLKPLNPEPHTISFSARAKDFGNDVTYKLNVK